MHRNREQDSSERITNKYVELIWNFLNHPETARNTLQSKDTVELYLALWSIGFYDTDEIRAIVPDIIRKGAKHQIQTLLYFLRCTQSSQMNHLISKDAFEVWHDDPKVVAAILPLYMDGLYLSRYSDNKEAPTLSDYFETPEEAVRHYGYLKQVYQSISAKEVYSPYVFPWDCVVLTRSDVVLKMAYIAWMTNDIRLREELCTYLPALESYNRASYIGIVLARTESKVEQGICAAITRRPFGRHTG